MLKSSPHKAIFSSVTNIFSFLKKFVKGKSEDSIQSIRIQSLLTYIIAINQYLHILCTVYRKTGREEKGVNWARSRHQTVWRRATCLSTVPQTWTLEAWADSCTLRQWAACQWPRRAGRRTEGPAPAQNNHSKWFHKWWNKFSIETLRSQVVASVSYFCKKWFRFLKGNGRIE